MTHRCRNCAELLDAVVCDLGMQPLANAFAEAAERDARQDYYPLKPLICRSCLLVQLPSIVKREAMFDSYPYFSGQSADWIEHCRSYAEMIVKRFAPGRALEIASNDGTLLVQLRRAGIDFVRGVEPAANVAAASPVPTIVEYWSNDLAHKDRLYDFDLIVANNVLAHVPDFDDFLDPVRAALAPDGVATFEFPWVVSLISESQWDTIYHEHYSYFSVCSVQKTLAARRLRIFDVEWLPTHGGSLRIYACKFESMAHEAHPSVDELLSIEAQRGYHGLGRYEAFQAVPPYERQTALELLWDSPLRTVGYGAPAKGVTFLNYCGLGTESIAYLVDSTPAKQGRFTAGTRIPVQHPAMLEADRAIDRVLVLPWNWAREIRAKIELACPWGPGVMSRPFA